jgi:hypothetical protein
MASGAAGGDGSPWPHNQVHGLEGKEGVAAFLPCSEATAEKMDGGDVALAEFGGGGELGRHSSGRSAAPQGDEDGVLVQRMFDERRAQHMKERKEGERRTLHQRRASTMAVRSRGGGAVKLVRGRWEEKRESERGG